MLRTQMTGMLLWLAVIDIGWRYATSRARRSTAMTPEAPGWLIP